MFQGFIKTAAAAPRLIPGDVAFNVTEIIDMMYEAADAEVRILVFPELCLTGATCGDLFLQDRLALAAREGLQDIVDASADLDLLLFVGLPWKKDGVMYNVTAAVKSGTILGLIPKCGPDPGSAGNEGRWAHFGQEIPELISTDIFNGVPEEDEEEAESGSEAPEEIREEEDWDSEPGICEIEAPFGSNIIFEAEGFEDLRIAVEMGEEGRMPWSSAAAHTQAGAVIVVNPCAVPAEAGAMKDLEAAAAAESRRLTMAYVRASAGPDESTADTVMSGLRLIVENGAVLASGQFLKNGLTISDIDFAGIAALRKSADTFEPISPEEAQENYYYAGFEFYNLSQSPLTRRIDPDPFVPASRRKSVCKEILEIQAAALAKRMRHTGSRRMVLGLSGGLDSTLALLVCKKAIDLMEMDASSILCISMPAFGTSDRTHDNAALLAAEIGAEHRVIDLKASLLQHFQDIGHPVDLHDTAYENAQARERTQILMDLANMEQGIVVGTGDLSEEALGWCTYNGDHMSMYAVNSDIPKTVIRQIVAQYAASAESSRLKEVLEDILDTPVSPELLPVDVKGAIAQKTEDIVGPYELHDFYLYYMLRFGAPPVRIAWLAEQAFAGKYTRSQILHWLNVFYRRFFASQFKRSCSADGPRIFSVSLSPRGGWQMPSDASGSAWISDTEFMLKMADNT